MIDIGGGSTEFVVGEGGEVVFHVSTQTGAVRQTERHIRTRPADPGGARSARARTSARSSTRRCPRRSASGRSAAIARRGHGDLARRDRPEIGAVRPAPASTATSCPSSRAETVLEMLAGMTDAQRREVPGLHPDRAPTIVAGAMHLVEALRAFGLDSTEVSEHDILRGAALEAVHRDATDDPLPSATRPPSLPTRRDRPSHRCLRPASDHARAASPLLWTPLDECSIARAASREAETDGAGKGVIVPKGVVVPAPAS